MLAMLPLVAAITVSVPPDSAPSVSYAADELGRYIGMLAGETVSRAEDAAPKKGFLVALDPESDDDSFRLRSSNGLFSITGGKRGVIYGVCEALERFGGVDWLSSWRTHVPAGKGFHVPDSLDERHAPAFALREVYYADVMSHFDFAVHLRLNGLFSHDSTAPRPADPKLGGKAWRFAKGFENSHTLSILLPVAKYFKEHPEYYAEVDGLRRDVAWQACLTNPDVLKIVTEKVLAALDADPEAKMIGISHNDNLKGYCRCANCAAVDEYEDSHAGTELRFVNAVADEVKKRHPGVLVQTLAYQYTRKPPKHERPRDNVVITLCSIECDRLRPFGAPNGAAVNKAFERDLDGWSKVTDKLYVWDYTGEMFHYMHPMLNSHIMQDNIRYFRDKGVKFVFSQGNGFGANHQEFAELKAWLVAKSLWNPDQPLNALLDRFFTGFYGAGAPHVRAYYELSKAQAESLPPEETMSIYQNSSRTRYPDSFVDKAIELWNRAEDAAAGDPEALFCVRMGKASTVRLKLGRMTEGVKWVWVTRHPEAYPQPDPRAAGYEKFLLDCEREAAARGRVVKFGNTKQRDLRPRQQWRRYVAAKRPAGGSDRAELGADELDITELEVAKPIDDAEAFGGRAVEISNRTEYPGPYLKFSGVAFDKGAKYRVRVHAKVIPLKDGYGEAIVVKAGPHEIKRDVKDVGAGYEWYEFEPFEPKGTDDIHVKMGHLTAERGGGRRAVSSIRVDRFEIVRAD